MRQEQRPPDRLGELRYDHGLDAVLAELLERRNVGRELLAAAYMTATDLDPRACALVEQHLPSRRLIRWFFVHRGRVREVERALARRRLAALEAVAEAAALLLADPTARPELEAALEGLATLNGG
ncbi:MAG TPA: hypothetical protein VFL91_27230 [Thermomicrobiales bacterium]|nr:hypothetical protein [Thermomicrobiales bacterium]